MASETAVEHALRLANGAKAKGVIEDYAIAGAFAFIYYDSREAWATLAMAEDAALVE